MIYKDYANYKGKLFSDDDIPLIHKQEAIDFIVEDWRKDQKTILRLYLFIDKRYIGLINLVRNITALIKCLYTW